MFDKVFLANRTVQAFMASMDQDHDAIGEIIEEIGNEQGHDGVYAMCCGLSEMIWRMRHPNAQRGTGQFYIETNREPQTMAEAARLWAARMVIAYMNDDRDTSLALFYGSLDDPDQAMSNVCALVWMAGDLGRQKRSGLN